MWAAAAQRHAALFLKCSFPQRAQNNDLGHALNPVCGSCITPLWAPTDGEWHRTCGVQHAHKMGHRLSCMPQAWRPFCAQVHAQWLADADSVSGYEQTGCAASMFANRLSWFFNFKGPSKIVDTGRPLLLCPRTHSLYRSRGWEAAVPAGSGWPAPNVLHACCSLRCVPRCAWRTCTMLVVPGRAQRAACMHAAV
jgi:hypothetical protein